METYELQNMELGVASAPYRFFEVHVLKPMAAAIAKMEGFYQDEDNAQLVIRYILLRTNYSVLFLRIRLYFILVCFACYFLL